MLRGVRQQYDTLAIVGDLSQGWRSGGKVGTATNNAKALDLLNQPIVACSHKPVRAVDAACD
jgi:hypothetical protein